MVTPYLNPSWVSYEKQPVKKVDSRILLEYGYVSLNLCITEFVQEKLVRSGLITNISDDCRQIQVQWLKTDLITAFKFNRDGFVIGASLYIC